MAQYLGVWYREQKRRLKVGRGQTVVEYLLILATVSGILMIFGVSFNTKILGGFFTIAGMIFPKDGASKNKK